MQLMTNELEKRFAEVGSQDGINDQIILAKFFYSNGAATWWATEYNPRDRMFFGFVLLYDDAQGGEWGLFSLDELQGLQTSGLGIERDIWWKEKPSSQVRKIMEKSPWIAVPA